MFTNIIVVIIKKRRTSKGNKNSGKKNLSESARPLFTKAVKGDQWT